MQGSIFISAMVVSLLGAGLAGPAFAGWNGKIIGVSDNSELSLQELALQTNLARNVVLGEKHYTPEVQQAEAAIIREFVTALRHEGQFTTAWEFLDYNTQAATDALFAKFVAGAIDAQTFLRQTQPGGDASTYVPVLQTTKELGGRLLGTNLIRSEKDKALTGGLAAVAPEYIPPGFAMGSPGYHDRFVELMKEGGHATPDTVENYYAAQCLTDDVIAYNMLTQDSAALRFLVVGEFHTEYFDGVVARLKIRAPEQRTVLIRIVDASDYTEVELAQVARDPKYGAVADYLYFVNEPTAAF